MVNESKHQLKLAAERFFIGLIFHANLLPADNSHEM